MSDHARPLNYRILVKPDEVHKETEMGIQQMSDNEWEMRSLAVDTGTVLELGPNAFAGDHFAESREDADKAGSRDIGEDVPVKVGDRVRFVKFAGHWYRERDQFGIDRGPYYRIINDVDVLQVIEEAGK